MSVLLCTLGASWAVIPEVYAFLMPAICPLYAAHPEPCKKFRHAVTLPTIDELWVVTTAGRNDTTRITTWWNMLGSPGQLRIWETSATNATTQAEVELIRELILRASLRAGPSAVLSLAGGRKTMSADLQRAGMAFGCAAMLHVLPPELARADLERLNREDFVSPLPLDLASGIQPVLVGVGHRNDLLAIEPAINTERFPLPDAGLWSGPGAEGWLWQALDERERDGGRLLANYHAEVARSETHENWRGLYRLPPATIERLRSTQLTEAHRDWLDDLPKADLHCHLGGILDFDEQIDVGTAVWAEVPADQRDQARNHARAWLAITEKSGGDRWTCTGIARAHAAAAILAETDRAVLEAALWPTDHQRFALKSTHPWGFKAYEHPGSLVGSTILQSPTATWATARAVRARCRRDGLAYLELRCSPQKYHAGFLDELQRALAHEQREDDALIRVIVIADRRQGDSIAEVMQLVLDTRSRLKDFVVGVDLAGDEQRGDPQELAKHFQAAFADCLRITIHAGEGEPADNIWKSAYHLHADRIGHGLTLVDAPHLAARFRDRRICLELCPTSNREVVGYNEHDYPGAAASYPLRQLMELGVPLTVCTDNPGISRTTLADEYLAAARMSDSGLSQWEVLALMKQGFLHSFLPASEREILIKEIDATIFKLMSKELTFHQGAPAQAGQVRWRKLANNTSLKTLIPQRGWHSRGYLPHAEFNGLTQSITFRLADALPTKVLKKLIEEAKLTHADDDSLQATWLRQRLDVWCDAGHGACVLRDPRCAEAMLKILRNRDGQEYTLHAGVVMPNHVHVLVTMYPTCRLSQAVGAWKASSAKEINRLLARTGALWQRDYFDRYIRDEPHFYRAKTYISENPLRAGLVTVPGAYPWLYQS